ncbi:hypothetical protein HK405_008589, partial [Cladochytrium tenue]
ITYLTIQLKGATACSFFNSMEGDICYREKIHTLLNETLLRSDETIHPNSQLDIPFQLSLPEPSRSHPELLRYAVRIANLLPPSTQFFGHVGGLATNPPFQSRTSYILTAELHQPSTFFTTDPVISANALVEPFIVHDPRMLPLIMQPDSKRWRSAPGDSPLEFEVELSATTLGPGDSFYFLYRLAVARDAAAKGVRISKVSLILREHRTVGTSGWGTRALRGSTEVHRWEFDEAPSLVGVHGPAETTAGGRGGSTTPAPVDTVELSDLRPRRKLAGGMTSYISRRSSASAMTYDHGGTSDDDDDDDASFGYRSDSGGSNASWGARETPPAESSSRSQTAGRRARRFADGWSAGPGGDGLYAENEARVTVPQRYRPYPFPTPSFHDDPAAPSPLPTRNVTSSTHLSSPFTVFTPTSARPSDSNLLYTPHQPPGTPVAQVDVKHSLQVRIEMTRVAAPRVRARRRRHGKSGRLWGGGGDEDGSEADGSDSDSDNGSDGDLATRRPPDPIIMECWCVLASVGRTGVEGLLDQRPELVPPLDYDKIFGASVVWLPPYEERDSTWPDDGSGQSPPASPRAGPSIAIDPASDPSTPPSPATAAAQARARRARRRSPSVASSTSTTTSSRRLSSAHLAAPFPWQLLAPSSGSPSASSSASASTASLSTSPQAFTSVLRTAPLPPPAYRAASLPPGPIRRRSNPPPAALLLGPLAFPDDENDDADDGGRVGTTAFDSLAVPRARRRAAPQPHPPPPPPPSASTPFLANDGAALANDASPGSAEPLPSAAATEVAGDGDDTTLGFAGLSVSVPLATAAAELSPSSPAAATEFALVNPPEATAAVAPEVSPASTPTPTPPAAEDVGGLEGAKDPDAAATDARSPRGTAA